MSFVPLDDNLDQYGGIISVEFFSTLTANLNYLMESVPVGEISPFFIIDGVNEPDPRFWQECDGSPIVDQTSPLRGYNAPDMTQNGGLYLKGADILPNAGQVAGANTKNLAHSHGGNTQNFHINNDADTDDDRWSAQNDHSHTISTDLGVTNFEPERVLLRHFIKIN
jgi:hypothetical protein